MRRSSLLRWGFNISRIRTLFTLLLLLPAAGCMHRQAAVVETYHLQDSASYPLLVPSHASSPSGRNFANSQVNLGSLGHDLSSSCSIAGPVFSLQPPQQTASTLWVVRSPAEQEWETQGAQINVAAEWTRFTQKLQSLQKNGCFAPGSTLTRNLQTIAESIPIPAAELLLFYYSYTGTGAIDLVPGMQIRVERGVLEGREGQRTMKSIEAQYEVLATASAVALRLAQTSNRHLSHQTAQEDKNIFDLVRLTQTATMLRLFLQSRTDQGIERKPMLLLSKSREGLDQATQQLDSKDYTNNCSAVNVPETSCISFTKSAVSLMISCLINGKLSYKPLGTTVSQAVNDSQAAVKSLVLTRRMTNGGYAALSFPRTLEAAGQLMLVNGDRLSW